jgi:hypothetical protein
VPAPGDEQRESEQEAVRTHGVRTLRHAPPGVKAPRGSPRPKGPFR